MSTSQYLDGVRVNFQLPDFHTVALGGGTIIEDDPITGDLSIGPQNVGGSLKEKALVFGGDTLTVTDVAVANATSQQLDFAMAAPDWVHRGCSFCFALHLSFFTHTCTN